MEIIDEVLWEQEVAEYMRPHAGGLDVMPIAPLPSGRRAGHALATVALVVMVLLVLLTGCSIGWYAV